MPAGRNEVQEGFQAPGFVSEQRPEFESVGTVSSSSGRPLFFARYRHDKPNLGLLEQTPLADQVVLSVELRPFRPINVFCDGQHYRKPASDPGTFALYDQRRSWCADIRDPFDTLQVFVPISSFQDFAAERRSSFHDFRFDIRELRYDSVMLHLMQAMLPTLERPNEVSTLYLDSMFLAVRDHVAETYGAFANAPLTRQGLSTRQLREVLEYIEANLSKDISLAELAAVSSTSTSSLNRGFKTSLNVSPHRWLLNRRIALAQRLIYESTTPLNEVALRCGFADQSHMTRVFARSVGSSPAAWRRSSKR